MDLKKELVGVDSIAVLVRSAMGDLLLAIPALKMLRKMNPQAHLTLFCDYTNFELARCMNLFDDVIRLSATRNRYLSMLLGMSRHVGKFDVFIALKGGYGRQNSLAAFFLRPKVAISYVEKLQAFSYFSERWITDRIELSYSDYVGLHYSTLVANLVVNERMTSIPAQEFWPCPDDFFPAVVDRARPDKKPTILIPVVDDKDPRMPSVQFWGATFDLLHDAAPNKFNLILCCQVSALTVANRVLTATKQRGILVVSPPNISALVQVVAKCDVCLGGDGGTMHIAAALNKRIFLFIDEDSVAKWLPLSNEVVWYRSAATVVQVKPDQVIADLLKI